ncbi:class I SAM-dependent methyltransferase [Streptomyces bohaiensis]|uniref:Class I SAM-dependent methyltransferase n=1 Tax=Streptomyces bohaiensis TaxID=1431344 RepID=A0ABX1CC72_9ACTN|nr:methyltransferase domain-containing protein [Streptomyces bohaiensis]NJQ16712.1 class I SAM-dependent methyltransferase [Streptomyces bohaiensis]
MSTSHETATPPAPVRCWSSEPYADALRDGRGPLYLRRGDGWLLHLDVERWCGGPDEADRSVLARCEGPVLDVGCGPGRLVAALSAGGRDALGIDISTAAVDHTTALGAPALRHSVFDPLPREGRWRTALVIDGNIGIGGDPGALLERLGGVLAPGGLLIAETAPVDVDERAEVRLVRDPDGSGGSGSAFPWARLGTAALLRHARPGWSATDQWSVGGRCFAALRNRTRSAAPERAKSAAVMSSQRWAKPLPDKPVTSA